MIDVLYVIFRVGSDGSEGLASLGEYEDRRYCVYEGEETLEAAMRDLADVRAEAKKYAENHCSLCARDRYHHSPEVYTEVYRDPKAWAPSPAPWACPFAPSVPETVLLAKFSTRETLVA